MSRSRMDPDSLSSLEFDKVAHDFAAKDEPLCKLQDLFLIDLCTVKKYDIEDSQACYQIPQLTLNQSTLDDCLNDILKFTDVLDYSECGRRLHKKLHCRMSRAKELGRSLVKINNGISPRVELSE